jgi:hypothetical protein
MEIEERTWIKRFQMVEIFLNFLKRFRCLHLTSDEKNIVIKENLKMDSCRRLWRTKGELASVIE